MYKVYVHCFTEAMKAQAANKVVNTCKNIKQGPQALQNIINSCVSGMVGICVCLD